MNTTPSQRYGLIARLAQEMPAGNALGRTALMKLMYFLQAVKKVPLGYHFSLYTYGPFDSDVLADLSQVQEQGGVKSRTVYYSGGYGYEITVGEKAAELQTQAKDFLDEYDPEIKAIVQKFGTLSPAMLELSSTLIFAFQESEGRTLEETLVHRVKQIKPRFTPEQIKEQYKLLLDGGFLIA